MAYLSPRTNHKYLPPRALRGSQYRRGYRHGYGEAMDDLVQAGGKRSRAWDRLADFLDGPLYDWSKRRTASMDMPPRFAGWMQSRKAEVET